MKKLSTIIFGVFLVFVLAGGGYLYYMMVPTSYYTQIKDTGKEIKGTYDNKEAYVQYEYTQVGYDKEGNEKTLTFTTHPELGRPFKTNAYLKIDYTRFQKEKGYEEVQEQDIPKEALEKIKETK